MGIRYLIHAIALGLESNNEAVNGDVYYLCMASAVYNICNV